MWEKQDAFPELYLHDGSICCFRRNDQRWFWIKRGGPRALGLTLELFFIFSSHCDHRRLLSGVPSWYSCFRKTDSVRRKVGCEECAQMVGKKGPSSARGGAAVLPCRPPGTLPQNCSWPLRSVPSQSQAGTPGHRAQPADTAPATDSGSLGCLEKPLTLYKLQLFVF